MRRVILAAAVLLFAAGAAFAAPKPTLNWGSIVNSGACSMDGDLVVNAVMKVTGDIDSGVAGNNWAFDTYNKSIQIWTTQVAGVHCVRVMYLGKFAAIAGQQTPGDASLFLTGNEKGSFEGGYFATVTGTLNPSPTWQAHGMVGNFDLGCDPVSGNCTGVAAASWLAAYFLPGEDFAYNWWGWIYHGGKYGVWSNNIDSTTGNIK
jgi:hypothetical protein